MRLTFVILAAALFVACENPFDRNNWPSGGAGGSPSTFCPAGDSSGTPSCPDGCTAAFVRSPSSMYTSGVWECDPTDATIAACGADCTNGCPGLCPPCADNWNLGSWSLSCASGSSSSGSPFCGGGDTGAGCSSDADCKSCICEPCTDNPTSADCCL